MDEAWWKVYGEEAQREFRGARVSTTSRARGVERVRAPYFRQQGQNSGAGAIALAAHWGATKIILLGYDCQHTGGKRHWHGDHPAGTAGNAAPQTVAKWPAQFRDVARFIGAAKVINATRETALDVFQRANLEDVLT